MRCVVGEWERVPPEVPGARPGLVMWRPSWWPTAQAVFLTAEKDAIEAEMLRRWEAGYREGRRYVATEKAG